MSPSDETLEEYNQRKLQEAHAAWARANPDVGRTMPNVSQMLFSKYISKGDVQTPLVVTIRAVSLENMDMRRPGGDQRWVMWFHEMPKGLRLGNVLLRYLEQHLGANSDGWIGRRVQLYVDPNVMMAGQIVGGVRLRVGRSAGAPQIPGQAAEPPRFDPHTGLPLTTAAPAPPRFDPYTGQPIHPSGRATGTVDAGTGEIYNKPAGAPPDPEFDDDIPF